MRKILKNIIKLLLLLATPITYLSTLWLKFVKRMGASKLDDRIFMSLGIFPVADHYYQPLVNPRKYLKKSLRDDRELKGIDFNDKEQLALLAKFNYNEELIAFPLQKRSETEYFYNNYSYTSGDAEYLYNMVRHFKPRRMIEIGSGMSTLMTLNAINKNKETEGYKCRYTCIEPYEKSWLEKLDIELLRKKVEDVDKSIFLELEPNDILFIDSSHIIRPQGDVLFEFLEVLPSIKPGVVIHVHDIFTPKDYRDEWIYDMHYMWNEQYILEAFLMFNKEFRVVGALNYLTHHYRDQLAAKCPIFKDQPAQEPGSFWMIRNEPQA